jgi:hypothetical protein
MPIAFQSIIVSRFFELFFGLFDIYTIENYNDVIKYNINYKQKRLNGVFDVYSLILKDLPM